MTKMIYRNYYECPHCKSEWSDDWSCQVDDDCPECGKRHISPYDSDEIGYEEVESHA